APFAAEGAGAPDNFVTCTIHGRPSLPKAQELQTCFANQKTLADAVTKYNRDHNTKVSSLDHDFLVGLVRDGYLKRLFDDPGQGPATVDHYEFSPDGNGMTCRVHGPAK